MKIGIVIPNYNGAALLEKNVPLLFDVLKKYHHTFELVIVDDASNDTSWDVISTFHSTSHIMIHRLQNKKNFGFSSTVDKGIRALSTEFVLLLNTDVVPERGFLEPLLKYFSDELVFAVGAMDKSIENGKTVLRGRGIGKWQRGMLIHSRGEIDKNSTLWVSGGSSLIRKSIYEKIGGFDSLFNPFYWEDIDLSYRSLKMGYKIYFEKGSIMIHSHDNGAIKSHYSSSHVKKIAYRNQFIFVWKNITDFNFLLSHFVWLPIIIGKAIIRRDKEFLIGFLLAAMKLPAIIKNRKYQKKSIVSDKEVLKSVEN